MIDDTSVLSKFRKTVDAIYEKAHVPVMIAGAVLPISEAIREGNLLQLALFGFITLAYVLEIFFDVSFDHTMVDRISRLLKKVTTDDHRSSPRDLAISVTYLKYYRRRNSPVKTTLIAAGLTLLGAEVWLGDPSLLWASFTCLALCVLLIVKEFVIKYRIANGFFGTNASEARMILRFLVSESDDIDFTDGNGQLRRALTPEVRSKQPTTIGQGEVA